MLWSQCQPVEPSLSTYRTNRAYAVKGGCPFASQTKAWGSMRRFVAGFSSLFSRLNRQGPDSVYQSARKLRTFIAPVSPCRQDPGEPELSQRLNSPLWTVNF